MSSKRVVAPRDIAIAHRTFLALGLVTALLVAGLTVSLVVPSADAQLVSKVAQPVCVIPLDPTPAPPLGRSNEPFPSGDHPFLHSGTHLQGKRAQEKYAGGLFYLPGGVTGFGGFTSAVVVDNPDPVFGVNVQIDYFDHTGFPVGSTGPHFIPPEGHHEEAATPLGFTSGIGAAHIRVLDPDHPGIVGATLHHTICVFGICDPDRPLSIFGQPPGLATKQQLQTRGNKTTLWWGPLPLSNLLATPFGDEFFNGQAPFLFVHNPNNAANTVAVDLFVFDPNTGVVTPVPNYRVVTLPPNGTLLEKDGTHLAAPSGLWDVFINNLLSGPVDLDILVRVRSLSDLPILGDGVMTDFFGPGFVTGTRFRAASTMLFRTPNWRLINPELSFDTGGILHTQMLVGNVGTTDAGPVRIEYYDNNNNLLSSATVASLPPNNTLRILPGRLNYPVVQNGFGWARITACDANQELIGLTVREVLPSAQFFSQYHKAYGEALTTLLGNEPGPGFKITDPISFQTYIRKVSPLVRTTPTFPGWGYVTFGNFAVSNIGPYRFRLFDRVGTGCGLLGFNGVPFGSTSWTYEDLFSTCNSFAVGNLNGRVDHTDGRIEGIKVLGDPLDEYEIPGFALNPGPDDEPFPGE